MKPAIIKRQDFNPLIKKALAEDLGARGDVTTDLFVPPGTKVKGRVFAKSRGVLCGTGIAAAVFKKVDPKCRVRVLAADGTKVRPGRVVMEVSGGRGILSAERTALNFLQHLSGVATTTNAYVEKVRGLRPGIFDTRKTLPGYRALHKYAVLCGGGRNHRMGLHDAVLLKDNHWACQEDLLRSARAVRRRCPRMVLEIEAASLGQVNLSLAAKPDIILLDNMAPATLRKAIRLIRKARPRIQVEISGGVDLRTVRRLARLGPDRISVGRITHSAPALDLSLELSW